MKAAGIVVAFIGVLWVLIAFNMDVGVRVENNAFTQNQKVINISLMDDRRNHLTGALVTVIVGVLIFGFSSLAKGEHKQNPQKLNRNCPNCSRPLVKGSLHCKRCGEPIAGEWKG